MTMFLAGWGKRVARNMRVVDYESLFSQTHLCAGAYIFSDLDYLAKDAVASATDCWNAVHDAGVPGQHLNHPGRVLRRYDLLRSLYERDINNFNVHRIDDDRSRVRFPVFLRGESDHEGPRSDLISTPEALADEIRRQVTTGANVSDWMVTEFREFCGDDGLYRKYGAFNVGGEIIPRHMIFGREWMVKGASRQLAAQTVEEERTYIESNPHADALREIFSIAQIDYGRVDYTMHEGRICVFEINTNPQIVTPGPSRDAARREVKARFAERFAVALEACNSPASLNATVPLKVQYVPVRVRGISMLERSLSLTRAVGLGRFEPQVFRRLFAMRLFWRVNKRKLWAHTPLRVRHVIRQLRHN